MKELKRNLYGLSVIGVLAMVSAVVLLMSSFVVDKGVVFTSHEASINKQDYWEKKKEEFLANWQVAKDYTMSVAEAMPAEDYKYKPSKTDSVRNFAQQLKHIGAINYGVTSIFLKDEPPVAPDPEFENKGLSKPEILGFIGSSYDAVTETVKSMSIEELLAERELFSLPEKPLLSKFEYLEFLQDHTTHHRAQAIAYLRSSGVEPPTYQYFAF